MENGKLEYRKMEKFSLRKCFRFQICGFQNVDEVEIFQFELTFSRRPDQGLVYYTTILYIYYVVHIANIFNVIANLLEKTLQLSNFFINSYENLK